MNKEDLQVVIDTLIVYSYEGLIQPELENIASIKCDLVDGYMKMGELYESRLTIEKTENQQEIGTRKVSTVEDFGIFAEDYNIFTNNEILWDTIVTQMVTYPGLYFAVPFFLFIYPIIDLYYVLSFQFTVLGEKVNTQLGTIGSLLYDIVTVPFIIATQLFLAFENVLWLGYVVFAWAMRVTWIVLDFLYL